MLSHQAKHSLHSSQLLTYEESRWTTLTLLFTNNEQAVVMLMRFCFPLIAEIFADIFSEAMPSALRSSATSAGDSFGNVKGFNPGSTLLDRKRRSHAKMRESV